MYHYAGNNPVKYTDPDGRNAEYSIDDTTQTVTITVPITIYGSGASDDVAKIYENGINDAWSGDWVTTIDGKEYKVIIKANVTVGDPPSKVSSKDSMNYIKVEESTTRSFILGGYKGEWRANGRLKRSLDIDNPAPHETGHLLGLDDRYCDVEVDGKIISQANEGWENNIMGGGSKVDQRNINGIMKSIPNPSKIKKGVLRAGGMNN